MTTFDSYNCGMCSRGPFPTRDAYAEHLEVYHPETWLAGRSKKERELREKRAAAKVPK